MGPTHPKGLATIKASVGNVLVLRAFNQGLAVGLSEIFGSLDYMSFGKCDHVIPVATVDVGNF